MLCLMENCWLGIKKPVRKKALSVYLAVLHPFGSKLQLTFNKRRSLSSGKSSAVEIAHTTIS